MVAISIREPYILRFWQHFRERNFCRIVSLCLTNGFCRQFHKNWALYINIIRFLFQGRTHKQKTRHLLLMDPVLCLHVAFEGILAKSEGDFSRVEMPGFATDHQAINRHTWGMTTSGKEFEVVAYLHREQNVEDIHQIELLLPIACTYHQFACNFLDQQ